MDRGQQAESAVQKGEIHFRRLLKKLPAGAYTCDPEGLITYFNQHAVRLWGRAPRLNDPVDRFCGSYKLFSPDGSPISHDRCWMALALKMEREYNGREIVIERPDGQRLSALAHANPIHDESGKLLGAVNVLVDINDRKRAEEALLEIRDAERTRIARDLHDAVLQDLSATLQSLQATQMESGRLELGQEVANLRRAVQGLRNAVYDLRFENRQSLLRAVESLLEFNRQRAPECEVSLTVSDGFPSQLPETLRLELVRMVQEALSNARRHSGARRIEVSLEADADEIKACVRDDGKGFEPERTRSGVGLASMKERAALIGGDLEIRSQYGEGTQVRFGIRRPY
ncbi:MAG TPA: ATP-binding protein [Rubrobacteraceae bacterium]|nr:ATP-binding protein [Rubrobacteraceae bacterium]